MIYLTTGGNGAGKTLFTLADVRKAQLEQNRPVYYHGFEMVQEVADAFGWKPFDPKDWQSLPDGSICIMDECQNEFPARGSRDPVPSYVNAIAQFRRKRGFDFYMICPHPKMLDVFIRQLIESPSWHRHMKRAFGADMVSELRFNNVDLECDKRNSGTRAQVAMRAFPKEVYNWYRSSSLHTGKKKIPLRVYVLLASFFLIPDLFYFAFSLVTDKGAKDAAKSASAPALLASDNSRVEKRVLNAVEYVQTIEPRIPAFPHTAPRYDEVTRAAVAPYPAACMRMGERCECFTQQATRLLVPIAICLQIVKDGFFVDWQLPLSPSPSLVEHEKPSAVAPLPAPAPASALPLAPPSPALGGYEQALAARNSQVRSMLQ